MESRWYTPVVILLWITTMTWLTVAKVLPQLRTGEPPGYQSLLARSEEEPNLDWDLFLNDRAIGYSHSAIERQADGYRLRNRVHLVDFPLRETVSEEFRKLAGAIDFLNVDIFSHVDMDAFGHLLGLQSTITLESPDNVVLRIIGTVHERQLQLVPILLNSLNLPAVNLSLTENSVLPDTMSPQGMMTNLHLNQEWTVPVFNPFNPGTIVEVVQAKVAREDMLFWNDRSYPVYIVEYRQSHLANSDQVTGQTWVRHDGVVLRQQVQLFTARLNFVRRAPNQRPAIDSQWDDTHDSN